MLAGFFQSICDCNCHPNGCNHNGCICALGDWYFWKPFVNYIPVTVIQRIQLLFLTNRCLYLVDALSKRQMRAVGVDKIIRIILSRARPQVFYIYEGLS